MNNTVYRHRFLFQEDSDKSVHCDCCRIMGNPKRRFRVLYRDRFNFLNQYSPVNWFNKPTTWFTSQDGINLDFEDLCLSKLENILKKHSVVNVMWSGGIDSSIIAAGLYHLADEYDCRKKVSFYCTQSAIDSFREGYEILSKVFRFVIFERNDESLMTRLVADTPISGCAVNGDSGVIFGQKAIDDEYCDLNFKDALVKMLSEGKIYNPKTVEVVERYVGMFDLQIESYYDLFRFFQFSLVTEFGGGVFLLSAMAVDPSFNRMISFFNDDDFARWFFANFHSITPFYLNDSYNYKLRQKRFIFKYLGTESVFNLGKNVITSFQFDKMSPNLKKRVLIVNGDEQCIIFDRPDGFLPSNTFDGPYNIEFSNAVKREFFYRDDYVEYR